MLMSAQTGSAQDAHDIAAGQFGQRAGTPAPGTVITGVDAAFNQLHVVGLTAEDDAAVTVPQ